MFGLVFGSFANVVIWRFPRGESLSHPDSHCPICDTPIQWRDNIPVLSWLMLRGKCRACGVKISARYPVVELMSGALWVLAGLRFGPSLHVVFAVAFFYLLLLLAWIDIDTMRLPNALVALLAVVGLAGALTAQLTGVPAVPLIGGTVTSIPSPLLMAILGALMSAVPALLLSLIMAAILKRPALGMGDVKLLGAMGVFLGAYGLMAFFVGSLVGVVFALMSRGPSVAESSDDSGPLPTSDEEPSKRGLFPFGPALAMGAVIVTLVGPQVWAWYLSLLAV